ncbi:hypothetical protein DFH09DRAFT_1096876 [Mycena vulgaris]|nr:hypothetical protein DFH09DRAFT_1096876 [Mycena vulgaris]
MRASSAATAAAPAPTPALAPSPIPKFHLAAHAPSVLPSDPRYHTDGEAVKLNWAHPHLAHTGPSCSTYGEPVEQAWAECNANAGANRTHTMGPDVCRDVLAKYFAAPLHPERKRPGYQSVHDDVATLPPAKKDCLVEQIQPLQS